MPSLAGVIFHGAWVIIFGALDGHYRVWQTCSGEGIHYIVVTAGLFGVFAYSFIAEAALSILGCRGEPGRHTLLDGYDSKTIADFCFLADACRNCVISLS